jgi:hypothetical protein
MNEAMKFACWLACAAVLCGCRTVRESAPPRTATEQLLLSTAANNALADTRFDWLEGKKTFVEDKYFESYDKGHAIGAIRERLSASGALLVSKEEQADIVVEIRSGVLSMDNSDFLIGLPAMAVPIPLTGSPVQTPELALYKSKRADSVAKFALFAYERVTGHYLRSVNPMLGRAKLCLYKVVFISWQKTDVPELTRQHKAKAAKKKSTDKPPPS